MENLVTIENAFQILEKHDINITVGGDLLSILIGEVLTDELANLNENSVKLAIELVAAREFLGDVSINSNVAGAKKRIEKTFQLANNGDEGSINFLSGLCRGILLDENQKSWIK